MQISVQRKHKISGDGQESLKNSSRSAFTRWAWAVLVFGLVALGGVVAGRDTPPYGFGRWINAEYAPDLCGPVISRLCAEFEDGRGPDSPHHGMFCCIEASEVESGRYTSCIEELGKNPRED